MVPLQQQKRNREPGCAETHPSAGVVKGTAAVIYTHGLLLFLLINTPTHPLRKKRNKTLVLMSKVNFTSLALRTPPPVFPEVKL